jgi:type IV pilus assembly protein PilA
MTSIIQGKLKNEKGFTLIELLVVVAIIGILVAIAVPQFASYKKNANDSTASTDVRNMVVAAESYFAANGVYPGTAPSTTTITAITIPCGATTSVMDALCNSGFTKSSQNNTLIFTNNGGSPQTFLLTGYNAGGTKTYTWNSASGGMQ